MIYKDTLKGIQRDRQINVRVTIDEKQLMEAYAKKYGMTIGQYVRWCTLYSILPISPAAKEILDNGNI